MSTAKDNSPQASVSFDTPKVDMTPEEKSKFLSSNPTRQEVATFVSAYLANEVLPSVIDYVNHHDNRNLALISVCQSILISQGIITKEEMDTLVKNWEETRGGNKSSSNIPGVVK